MPITEQKNVNDLEIKSHQASAFRRSILIAQQEANATGTASLSSSLYIVMCT